jgi:hypothetical protein
MFDVLNDVPGYLVAILGLLIAVVIGSVMIDGLHTHFTGDPTVTNETLTASEKFSNRFLSGWDLFVVTMVFIIFGGSVWLAYRLPASPVLLWGGLLYLVVVIFASMIVSNVYDKMLNNSITFADKVAQMTFFPIIMNNLMIIAIIYIVTITTVLMIGGDSGTGGMV